MSTYYSFITEPIREKELIEETEAELKEMGAEYVKIEKFGNTIFAGAWKNLGGGLYEFSLFPVKLAWISDEDDNGFIE